MIETYQQEQEQERQKPQGSFFATIGGVYEDGVSLIFAGETTAATVIGGTPGESIKRYKCNPTVLWEAGMRAFIMPITVPGKEEEGGNYFVICPVGVPGISTTTSVGSD